MVARTRLGVPRKTRRAYLRKQYRRGCGTSSAWSGKASCRCIGRVMIKREFVGLISRWWTEMKSITVKLQNEFHNSHFKNDFKGLGFFIFGTNRWLISPSDISLPIPPRLRLFIALAGGAVDLIKLRLMIAMIFPSRTRRQCRCWISLQALSRLVGNKFPE